MYTREEFEKMRIEAAKEMAEDEELQQDALDVLVKADKHNWIHQTNWFGEPVLQLPHDLFALQEIIYKTRPEYIIELGVAWGGSLLFYATLMKMLGGKRVIGVDIYIPEDLKRRLYSHAEIMPLITLINGSSTAPEAIKEIKDIVGNSNKVMVILDSYHTHEHVLNELRLYSPLVGKGYYLICGDTIIESIPEQEHRQREWGHGNNPQTALLQFLKENDRFAIDKTIENKLLLSCNPNGYLVCVKDNKKLYKNLREDPLTCLGDESVFSPISLNTTESI